MTDQRHLKRRVRERMAKTGESYTAARKHILDQRPAPEPEEPAPPPAFDVVDPIDLSDAAAAIGLKCRVKIFPTLAARIDTGAALLQLRDALLATEDDPWTQKLRASVLRGELQPQRKGMSENHIDLLRFVRRATAGLGGVSPSGTILALHVGSEIVLYVLSTQRSFGGTEQPQPLIWIHSITESIGTLKVAGLLMR